MSNRYYGQPITRQEEYDLGLRAKCSECGVEADASELLEVMGELYCKDCCDDMDRGEPCAGCGNETKGVMNKVIPCCEECFENHVVVTP